MNRSKTMNTKTSLAIITAIAVALLAALCAAELWLRAAGGG